MIKKCKNAKRFLFNDDYQLEWGDLTTTPRELLDSIDVDIDYIRRKIKDKLKGHDPIGNPLKRPFGSKNYSLL